MTSGLNAKERSEERVFATYVLINGEPQYSLLMESLLDGKSLLTGKKLLNVAQSSLHPKIIKEPIAMHLISGDQGK